MSDREESDERDPEEEEKIDERRALSATVVHEALRSEGREEIGRPAMALAWSGLAAGLSMGLSLLAEGALQRHLPEAEWRPLLTSLGYSIGFVAVTLGRQQLFTETTLTALLPFLHDPRAAMLMRTFRLWGIVLGANLVGAFLIAWGIVQIGAFQPALGESFREIGLEAAHQEPWTAFVRGIFGGWLIALMVWLLPSAHNARLWVIILITWLLAASQLTHIVAGSIEVFHVVVLGEVSLTDYLVRYGVPVLLGNTIGGVVFVALLNHAQVVGGEE